MAINTFLTAAGDKLTVASNNQNVFGSTGTQTVLVNSGVTGIAVSNTVERIELAGNMSTYKFVTVTGTGLQIQDSTGAVVGTVASTEGATVAFADGSAALVQTPTSFTIGGTAVAVGVTGAAATVTPTTPLNATDKSTVTGATTTTPTFSVTASSVTEGNVTADNKQLTFTATLSSAAPAGGVTVNYATASGTGTAGAVTASDFVAKTGTLTFAVGETTKTFTVDVVEDTAYEPNETFTVNFNTPVGVTLGTTSVTGTINDDDPNVTPTITKPAAASGYVGVTSTITGLSVADTNDGNLTVTLTAPAGALLTVTATSATVGGATPSVLSATGTSLTGVAAGTVIVSGAKADVNATLATFAYLTNRLDPGTDVVTVKVEDPNGAGATATGVATTTMDVSVGVQKTFTSSTDDFSASGTGGSDLFTGTAANVLAADKVGGAEGTDTVKITAANGDGGSVVATGVIATTAWTSIEVVDVTSYTTAAAANNFFDGDSVTGLTTFNYTDGQTAPTANPDNLTLLDLPTAIAVNLKSDMAAVSIGSKVAASTATINLADGVDIATSLTVAASTVKPATLGITTAGTTGSFITAFAAPGATVNISGTAALTFGTALATGVTIVDTTGALATVDATNLAGALKIDLANHITLALTTKGGSAADTIVGAIAVVNTISGNGGNDTISLSTNAVDGNTLSGNAGDDTITGGTGADTINGGAGKDTLTGGTGADTFVFTVGDSTSVSTTWDSITDLSSGDKINLSGYGINGTNGVALTSNAGAKAANGTKEAYLDTTNQLLVIETSDSGTAVTTESIAIGIAALGALTSNGAGVYTAGPVALVTTNNEAGKLTISGSPIDFANTPVQVNIDNTGTNATLGGNKHANADITDDFLSASVDMNSDANFFTGTSPNGAVDGTDKIGTNAVNDVDANFMAAGGVDIAGNSNANSLTGSQADDKIFGYAGADTILGGAGADLLVGGADADAITGGAGADTIFGGAAKDTITVTESDADVAADTITLHTTQTAGEFDSIIGFRAGTGTGNTDVLNLLNIKTTVATVDNADAVFVASAVALTSGAAAYAIGTTNTTDIFEITTTLSSNGDLGKSGVNDGTELLKALSSTAVASTGITTTADSDNFYLVAYQGGKAYLYQVAEGAGATLAVAADITLVSVFEGITAGAFESGDFKIANGLLATSGADTLVGDGVANIISGLAGNDTITGGVGVDTLSGDAGDDVFVYAGTAELVTGNAVIDLVDGGAPTTGDAIRLDGATTIAAADLLARITNVEKITAGATAGVISITGTAAANTFTSTSFTTIDLSGDTNATGTNVVDLTGATGITAVTGSAGIDNITFGAVATAATVSGGADVDVIALGVADNVTLAYSSAADVASNNTVTGFTAGADKLAFLASYVTGSSAGTLAAADYLETAVASNADATVEAGLITTAINAVGTVGTANVVVLIEDATAALALDATSIEKGTLDSNLIGAGFVLVLADNSAANAATLYYDADFNSGGGLTLIGTITLSGGITTGTIANTDFTIV